MDFKLRPSHSTESFKEKFARSTVFDATIEQALISASRSRKAREILNINREKTELRSSSTFESSVFGQSVTVRPRVNSYKPRDNISLNHLGNSPTHYYRKSIVSDFQPNFQPKYKYESTWAIDSQTFTKSTPTEPAKDLWIKPVPKKNTQPGCKNPSIFSENRSSSPQIKLITQKKDFSQGIYAKSTRPSSSFTSRTVTPQPRKFTQTILFTEQNRISTEESVKDSNCRLKTEPDYFKRSVFENINNRVEKTCRKKAIEEPLKSEGSVLECKPWDFSKEIFRTRENVKEKNDYDSIVQTWRNNRVLAVFCQDKKVPSYMRKTISSICKSKNMNS